MNGHPHGIEDMALAVAGPFQAGDVDAAQAHLFATAIQHVGAHHCNGSGVTAADGPAAAANGHHSTAAASASKTSGIGLKPDSSHGPGLAGMTLGAAVMAVLNLPALSNLLQAPD